MNAIEKKSENEKQTRTKGTEVFTETWPTLLSIYCR